MSESTPSPAAPSVPPGWHPVDPLRQRYWDGNAWTDHYAPIVQPVPVVPQRPTSALAVTGLVLSIVAVIAIAGGMYTLLLLGLPSVIFCALGIMATGPTDNRSGRGAAITGLIFSVVAIVGSTWFFIYAATLR